MTEQPVATDAAQADYDAAPGLMRAGEHGEAQAKLKALIAQYEAAPDTICA